MFQLPLFGELPTGDVASSRRSTGLRMRRARPVKLKGKSRPPAKPLPPGYSKGYARRLAKALRRRGGRRRAALAALQDATPFDYEADVRDEAEEMTWGAIVARGQFDQGAE